MRRERASMQFGMTKFHGLDSVRLRTVEGGITVVTTYDAHLVSWVPPRDAEHQRDGSRRAQVAALAKRPARVTQVLQQISHRFTSPISPESAVWSLESRQLRF